MCRCCDEGVCGFWEESECCWGAFDVVEGDDRLVVAEAGSEALTVVDESEEAGGDIESHASTNARSSTSAVVALSDTTPTSYRTDKGGVLVWLRLSL